MPVSRKAPRKAAASSKSSSAPTAQAFKELLATFTEDDDEDALSKAQNVMYDAWERKTSRSRIALARKALTISPLCADAYNLLAGEAKTPEEARDLYLQGVEAGHLALGPTGFKEFDGHFWGFLETRPYMRARHGLAMTLLALGEEDAALDHFRAMLTLNPNDNQGIRYLLLAALVRRDAVPEVRKLLSSYVDDGSANWVYTQALMAFREGAATRPATLKLLKDARASNTHVAGILAGTKPPVFNNSGYITMGGADEATDYVMEFGKAWKDTPGAIAWLVDAIGQGARKRVSGKARNPDSAG